MFTTNLKEKPLPPGTRIVTLADKSMGELRTIKRGSVGVVTEKQETGFKVSFPDGREALFFRDEIQPQRDTFRAEHVQQKLTYENVRPFLAFEVITGSTAYGLATPLSDEDHVGAYVLPSQLFWSMKEYQDTVTTSKPDGAYHEIKKFIQLACKGNPNTIELGEIVKIPELVTVPPQDEVIQEIFDRWYDIFVSQYVFSAYQSYAINQFKKIEQDLRNRAEIRWKHACHLLRLLWSGAECLRTGRIVVRPKDSVLELLKAVRHGQLNEDQFKSYRLQLEEEFQEAFDKTKLQTHAKFEEANKLLIAIRQRYFNPEFTSEQTFLSE